MPTLTEIQHPELTYCQLANDHCLCPKCKGCSKCSRCSYCKGQRPIKDKNYYPLWQDKDNPIHQMQWEHLSITIDVAHKATELADDNVSQEFAGIARSILDPALHSCQFWWASKKPMWDINMVYRGLNLQREVLLNAYKAISKSNAKSDIKKEYYYKVVAARHIFDQITDNLYTD